MRSRPRGHTSGILDHRDSQGVVDPYSFFAQHRNPFPPETHRQGARGARPGLRSLSLQGGKGRGKRARCPTIECEVEERDGFYRLSCVARDVAPPLPVNIVLGKAGYAWRWKALAKSGCRCLRQRWKHKLTKKASRRSSGGRGAGSPRWTRTRARCQGSGRISLLLAGKPSP